MLNPGTRRPELLWVVCAAVLAVLSAPVAAQTPTVTPLVQADWLAASLDDPQLVIVDIRGRTRDDPFALGHIPGAVWSAYPGAWRGRGEIPGAVPQIADLESHLSSLGVSAQTAVVIVPAGSGATEFGGAARVYWTLKYLGHQPVAILDGGYAAWTADPGHPVATGPSTPETAVFVAEPDPSILASVDRVRAELGTSTVLVDARPAEQYLGKTKSAAAAAFGRIPGAINLDSAGFYDPGADRLKPVDELRAIAEPYLSENAQVIAYCNAGHWSATDWFVLHELLGYTNTALYVQSFIGWSRNPDNPVERPAD